MQVTLGLGEMGVINNSEDNLKTFALGSCVGVVLIDKKNQVVGMAHVVLPDSINHKENAAQQPGRFADTAIPLLIDAVKQNGGTGKLIAKLAGGAMTISGSDTFQIGKRNALAVKKLLWKYRVPALIEELGGKISRTISADVDGNVTISTPRIDDKIV